MFRRIYICFMLIAGSLLISEKVTAQEFPIVTASTPGVVAFDGTNFLVGHQGHISPRSVCAQLVSANGSLVGPNISLGVLGKSGKAPWVAFDGTNYLMVWCDSSNAYYGQFINTSGNLVGTPFTIAASVTTIGKGGCITFNDNTYMLVRSDNNILYAQRISKSGNLTGSPIKISDTKSGESAIAFDGTNYLIVFRDGVEGRVIWGQFISKTGEPVGSTFVLDGGQNLSDNPVYIAFDGSRYFVSFHESAPDYSGFINLFARFVTPSGTIDPNRITIRDSTYKPGIPVIAFDGTNYLITWTDNFYTSNCVIMGRFFNTSGVPIGNEFKIFDSLNGKVPFNGFPVFGNNKFLIITIRVDPTTFTNGDVYGTIIQSSTTGIKENEINIVPKNFSLYQNYPNPFNPTTTINFSIPKSGYITLKIYDMLGREITTLVNEEKSVGNYEVNFDGSNLSSGLYFYRLQAGSFTETKKLILMK